MQCGRGNLLEDLQSRCYLKPNAHTTLRPIPIPTHTAGNRPEELPEQVLAAARIYRIDFAHAKPFPAKSLDEMGNGTGPSHDGEAHR